MDERNVAGTGSGDVGTRLVAFRYDGDPADGRADGDAAPTGIREGFDLIGAPLDTMDVRFVNGQMYRRLVPVIGGSGRGPSTPPPAWLDAYRRSRSIPASANASGPPIGHSRARRGGRGRPVGVHLETGAGRDQPPPRRRRRRVAVRRGNSPTTSTKDARPRPNARWCSTSGSTSRDLGPIALLLDHTSRVGHRQRRRDAGARRCVTGDQRTAGRTASARTRDRCGRRRPDVARRRSGRSVDEAAETPRRLPPRVRHAAHDRLRRHRPHARRDARCHRGDAERSASARRPHQRPSSRPSEASVRSPRLRAAVPADDRERVRRARRRRPSAVRAARRERTDHGRMARWHPAHCILLEAGRRLVAAGRLRPVDHVFDLSAVEMVGALRGEPGPRADAVATRHASVCSVPARTVRRTSVPHPVEPDLDGLPGADGTHDADVGQ